MNLDSKIEAILFFKAEPVSIKKLGEILNKNEEEIKSALYTLKQKMEDRGLTLLEHQDKVELATSSEMSDLIEEMTKEELSKDLGKAGLETLAIVIYKGPVSKKDIDYIRGVNSSFILRNLMVRGLVERRDKQGRSYIYEPSIELLQYLGISKIEEMPEYSSMKNQIEEFENQNNKEEDEAES